jgi:Cd2+/Zn2+-exporting ATPase
MRAEPKTVVPSQDAPSEAPARCVRTLLAVLQAEPGVRGVMLDLPAGQLCLRYDPQRVAPERVQRLAQELGVELVAEWEQCPLRQQGVRCSDCVQGLLATEPPPAPGGPRVAVRPEAEAITVEYTSDDASLPTISKSIARVGYLVRPAPRTREALHAARAREEAIGRRMAALTLCCLLATATAWLGETTHLLAHPAAVALYSVAYLTGGVYSTRKALQELRTGTLSVDMLMILAALGAATVNAWVEGAVLLFLFSASNSLETYVLGRTRRAIEAVMDLSPEEAVVRREGQEQRVPVEALRLGDTVIVRPGERIAADGCIVAGSTSIDQAAMTGESVPVEKQVGDTVFAGTLNQQGAIEVEVTRLAGQTTLARIVQLVAEAQSAKAHSQRFTDWFGARYTLGVLGAALLTLLIPILFLAAPFGPTFYRAMTVLVVASPCAVVIAIPATILAAISGAARGGVLFKGGAHLEQAATLRAIAFDKTGTLTLGRPRLVDIRVAEGASSEEVLCLAASAESLSEHPLARAIVEAAKERGLQMETATSLEALVGRGVRAQVGERSVLVGKAPLFTEQGITVPADLAAAAVELAAQGKTTVFVGDTTRVLGLLAASDTLRTGTEEAIRDLRALGIARLVMLTGDNPTAARAIATRLGMDFEAELMPEDKLRVIERLRTRYGAVAMVGDGINDAPSLAAANLGVSLAGTGTDVALETADLVLMAADLRHLPYAISLARHTDRIIRQNLFFAFGMMALLLTMTYLGHLRLPLAVLGHEGSTVLVILNGLRLLAFPRAGS